MSLSIALGCELKIKRLRVLTAFFLDQTEPTRQAEPATAQGYSAVIRSLVDASGSSSTFFVYVRPSRQ
jgi:hypothetical protein